MDSRTVPVKLRVQHRWWLAGLMSLIAVAAAVPSRAQNRNGGEIRGTVQDSSSAAVPDVSIVITDTGITTTLHTGSTGVFDAPSLEPGNYTVTFSKDGFQKTVRKGIILHVDTITVNATLEIGATSQEITVASEAPLLQTEASERNLILTSESATELPNVGRSWYVLTGLLPGVNPGVGQDASGQAVGVNGTQGYQGNWLVDGGSGTLPISNNPDALQVPLEAIAEVNLNTSNFGAEYGNGLSVFNVITKSGTNQFHGSAFEFVQNDAFNARNFFAPNVPPIRWNQYGGTVGGPIKRNKAFFFFSYQRNPQKGFSPSFYTYPTDAMRQGDFSGPGQATIYDPATTTKVNGQFVRQPFAGNKIPTSRLDPVALAIQKYYPEPNQAGIFNNYFADLTQPSTGTYYNFKVDHNLAASNRISVSGMIYNSTTTFPSPDCPLDCANVPIDERSAQLTDVWTINPTTVNEFRFSLSRERLDWHSPSQGAGYPDKIGLKNAAYNAFPTISVGGPVGMNNISGGLANLLGETSFVTSDMATLVKGKHTIKFGGEFDKWQQNGAWNYADAGTFSFSGIFTRNPVDTSSSGLGYADFLIGLPQTWSVTQPPDTGGRVWNLQMFVQDYYKIRPNLTINFGVRYLLQPGWTEVHNRLSTFDPSIMNPATGTLGAMWYAGQKGHNALEATIPDFFAPRVGFAWSPRTSWSIRGGYGIFNVPYSANSYNNPGAPGWAIQGFQTSTDLITPIFTLAQGPPLPLVPGNAQRTPDLLNGQSVNFFPYHTPMGYVQQWQLNVQHQFARSFLADVAYVGSRGVHLGFGTDINQVPENLLGPGDAQQNRPYPQFSTITASNRDGFSFYDALQMSARKQFANGFSFVTSYTWSKYMDTGTGSGANGTQYIDVWQNAYSPQANYGPSSNHMTHLWSGSILYELPFGKGKPFLSQGGILDAIVGGWELSSLMELHSGVPFMPVIGTANLSGAL